MEAGQDSGDAPPSAELIRLRQEVAGDAEDLTRYQQLMLLGAYWPRLPHAGLLPLARYIATHPQPDSSFRDQAYLRWCELSAAECEPSLIREMRNPVTELQKATLLLLPEKERPELDGLLGARLTATASEPDSSRLEKTSALIERYASKAVAPDAIRFLTEPPGKLVPSCDAKEDLIAYLLRVNPAEGERLLKRSLEDRAQPGHCPRYLLPAIADLHYVPLLSEMAASMVHNGSEPEAVAGAAALLSKYGPVSAEQVLWDRFSSWSAAWRNRGVDLEGPALATNPLAGQVMLEHVLASALAEAQTWKLTPSDITRLRGLCVTEDCRSSVAAWTEHPESRQQN